MTPQDDGKPCSLTRFLIEEQRAGRIGPDLRLLLDEVARERNGFIAAACVGHGHEG